MLQGMMPVLLSPMHEGGSPDHDGYVKLLDYLYETPLPGLWALGSAGEAFNMSYEHRVEVAKVVAEHMAGRTCLLMGAGSMVLPNIYRFFEETAHLPITGYHVMPIDRKLNTQEVIDYYTDLAERSPRPLWLYSNPMRMMQFTFEAIKELSAHPNIAGMKVGGYDMALASKLATISTEDFQVLGAGGGNLLGYLAYGIECVTMSTGSCFPKGYTAAIDLWLQGKIKEAQAQAFRMNKLVGSLGPWKNTEDPAELKVVLELFGICQRWTYPPFKPCTDGEAARIQSALVEHGYL